MSLNEGSTYSATADVAMVLTPSSQDVILSVLEASATRRDARGYLAKYAYGEDKQRSNIGPPYARVGFRLSAAPAFEDIANVAIMKIRAPQQLGQATLEGIAKTLSQLRVLGLIAVIIADCGVSENRQTFEMESLRLCEAIDGFGNPGAKLAGTVFVGQPRQDIMAKFPISCGGLHVDDHGLISSALRRGLLTVIPCLTRPDEVSSPRPASSREAILALTRYLSGLQFDNASAGNFSFENSGIGRPKKIASVERIILLEPLGGIPLPGRPSISHRFINLEQEYSALSDYLDNIRTGSCSNDDEQQSRHRGSIHAENLAIAKDTLSILPPSSSALITTPLASANIKDSQEAGGSKASAVEDSRSGFYQMVATRKLQNPLLHNLLTDKPVFSPSLPLHRIQSHERMPHREPDLGTSTVVKRGMPVTIFPDPGSGPWSPPIENWQRLRLTDTCIDLPRLVHLIEDSFGRKLNVRKYLDRVNEKIAGIIVVGQYEGAAIFTWEQPDDAIEGQGGENERLVPYLDKFAVLRRSQGSAGVADILFNAMVRDCFPEGVCWRSRNDNPVNKWYFERSAGTCKLPGSGWTMFWTTAGLGSDCARLRDYETVCRSIGPSWAEDKHGVE